MEESQELLEKATRERIRKNGFMLHNHIELESVERDRAVFKLDIRPESCNPYGMVHDGRYYVTQTSALHFLRNQSRGTVRATAWVRHRGKSTVLTSVDITGEDGKLLATGEFTFFCVDKSLMDQKVAKPEK